MSEATSSNVGPEQRGRPAVVALNCGSSTVKFAVFVGGEEQAILSGAADALETPQATLRWTNEGERFERPLAGANHEQAIDALTGLIATTGSKVVGVGHRVVHGGELFAAPAVIDDDVLAKIEELVPLAPLHNPANLLGIRLMANRHPGIVQVAVFDTAFHQTLPPRAYRYALPGEFYERFGVRRYGFHGTSHRFVAEEAARRLGRPLNELQLITVHLGNGCSACAIKEGRSVDTTMGLTPAEGMMMGTRSGDVDPALHGFLAANAGLALEEITHLLNRRSGLLGVSGSSNDRRQLEQLAQAGDERAALALEMFCFRAARSVLGMTASLDRLDALVFAGGIGENSAWVRRRIVEQMALLQIELDAVANEANGAGSDGRISLPYSTVCLVVPTNEELAIAREVWKIAGKVDNPQALH